MHGIPKKNLVAAAGLLIVFGLVRLPIEHNVDEQLRAGLFTDDNIGLPMMEKLGQDGFAAALGGFRPLVASYYYLIAHHNAFDKEEWGRVDQQFGLITTLQPRSGHYWDQYVWHLGWNAYAWANNEADYQRRLGNEWKASNLENITAPGYLDRAVEVAERGATMVGDDWRFYQRVGFLYEDKFKDPCKAAEWFQRGADVGDAPKFMGNIAAIFLSRCEGNEDEAYPLIAERYWNPAPGRRAVTVLIQMEALEDRLAQRELDELGIDAVRRLVASAPEDYLHSAALARYYTEVENSPEKAMGVYEGMVRSDVRVPSFYKKKWAMLAAGFPEREKAAYATLRTELEGTRWRLSEEEAAVVRPLEDRLKIPEDARLFRAKKKKIRQ
ncbi:MAG: hypothetical protein ACI8XO_000998 [Verrucomicrobiales bacterium]|jgi:hypothetical protein